MKQDTVGKAFDRSSQKINIVLDRLLERFPMGPYQAQLTPSEFRSEVRRMRGESLLKMAEINKDEVVDALRGKK